MRLVYTLHTAKYFVGEHEGHDSEARDAEEEVWPPFKKVGNYSPYSDDPRFAVTKIFFSVASKTLTVAGNGGQVLIFDLAEEETSVEVQVWVIVLLLPPLILPIRKLLNLTVKQLSFCFNIKI